MNLWLWFIVGVLFGIVCFIAAGPLLGPALPRSRQKQLGDFYIGIAMEFLGRVILVRRKHGGFDLKPSKWDAKEQSEKTRIGGETRHFEDPDDMILTLKNRNFGMVFEGYNIFVDPMMADVAAHHHEWIAEEQHQRTVDVDGARMRVFTRYMPIPDSVRNIDIKSVRHMMNGSADPGITETADEYTRKSQEGFDTADVIAMGGIAMLFVVGFGTVVLGARYAGDGGGSSSTIPLMIDMAVTGWFR